MTCNMPDGFPDPNEPTWFNQIQHARELLRTKGYSELLRHARISSENRHFCHDCFCCACLVVARDPEKYK